MAKPQNDRRQRRNFSDEEKERILTEADACTERGQLGELLRREGIYSSHLSTWRQQRGAGGREALAPKRPGPKPSQSAEERTIAQLQRKLAALVHHDRGAPMTSHTFKELLKDLGVNQSMSRPRVWNDSAFSESLFRTTKYQPDYLGRFADIDAARVWFQEFFDWYNEQHHHDGLALSTPAQVLINPADAAPPSAEDLLDTPDDKAADLWPAKDHERVPTFSSREPVGRSLLGLLDTGSGFKTRLGASGAAG